jgi:hypothetical protein
MRRKGEIKGDWSGWFIVLIGALGEKGRWRRRAGAAAISAGARPSRGKGGARDKRKV